MSEWDESLGLVERGTAGHHASAQAQDVAAEVAWLDLQQRRCMFVPLDEVELMRSLVRLRAVGDRESLAYAREQRAIDWLEGADIAAGAVQGEREELVERLRWQKLSNVRADVRWPLEVKLAALEPWRRALEDGERKRSAQGVPPYAYEDEVSDEQP